MSRWREAKHRDREPLTPEPSARHGSTGARADRRDHGGPRRAADRSGIVKDDRFSDAARHDSNFIDALTQGEKKMVVADSASRSAEREEDLTARGVSCAIAFKRKKGQEDLPPLLKRLNPMIASVRAIVEHPFAWMKGMGDRSVRSRGRRRNEPDFALNLIAYN
jgi:IS5 family transposase